ncbi:MAG: hypothetical protein V4702_01485 [Patescibacteria group bacterium]
MDKRKLHHYWKTIKKVKYWYFLIAAVIFGVLAVSALRQNNLRALELRDEVLKTDQQNGDTEAALRKLREHVYAHMNTNLATSTSVYPPIQLKYRYERLVAAEKARVGELSKNNIYNDAQKYCEQNFPQSFFGAGRLPCIQGYIDSHPAPVIQEQAIPDSLYKFNFESPRWSFDLAGWSIILGIIFVLLFVARFVLELWFRQQFKSHL